jgi:hypothetical protein
LVAKSNERTNETPARKQQRAEQQRLRIKIELSAKWPHDAQTRGVRNNMKSSPPLCSYSLFIARLLEFGIVVVVVVVVVVVCR